METRMGHEFLSTIKTSSDDLALRTDRVLVLVGPQGSGKTLLGRGLAMTQLGTMALPLTPILKSITGPRDRPRFSLTLPAREIVDAWPTPKACIVDDVSSPDSRLDFDVADVLGWVDRGVISARQSPQADPVQVPTPAFVVCSGDASFLGAAAADPRFHVVHVHRQP
jgi:hypothetical protein